MFLVLVFILFLSMQVDIAKSGKRLVTLDLNILNPVFGSVLPEK